MKKNIFNVTKIIVTLKEIKILRYKHVFSYTCTDKIHIYHVQRLKTLIGKYVDADLGQLALYNTSLM